MKTLTAKTETKNLFPNLLNALTNEHLDRLNDFKKEIAATTKLDELTGWKYNELIPRGKNLSKFTFEKLREYLIERKVKATNKAITKDTERLLTVSKAGDLMNATISIEWKRSQMWGSNPTASASVQTSKGWNNYESGSIPGCGYDKESTAVANALNQENAILKALYLVKENNIKKNNRDVFGYGSGYGILPLLEGGVGTSCYPAIFKTIGYEFKSVAHGKMFDVYEINTIVK